MTADLLEVPVQADPFPSFAAIRRDYPLKSGDFTIWPDVVQTRRQWITGHPLEFSPFRYDFIEFSSDGRLEIKPHYDKSTFDTFWIHPDGRVKAQAYWGLFPVTLGQQPKLLAGIIATAQDLGRTIEPDHPEEAAALGKIVDQLTSVTSLLAEERPDLFDVEPVPKPEPGMRAAIAKRLWQWKLGGESEAAPQ